MVAVPISVCWAGFPHCLVTQALLMQTQLTPTQAMRTRVMQMAVMQAALRKSGFPLVRLRRIPRLRVCPQVRQIQP